MSLRQAAAKLLSRRPRSSPHKFTASPFQNKPISSGILTTSGEGYSGGYNGRRCFNDRFQWIFLSGQAAFILGISATPTLAEDVSVQLNAENDSTSGTVPGFRKIEDGSVISNEHTSKWRIFTDNGRDYFLQGKLDQAEKFFVSAVQEAREGFGERDPHVASACNNLAELYRVQKAFAKAEPLYLEAINILEEAFGPDDIRVGAALHNLGGFYLVQKQLEKARGCYEGALKIKRRVLGSVHLDYADTMYHLGTVLYLQGKEKESENLIRDSIRILEEGGQGESLVCIRRLRYLAQVYIKSNQIADCEHIQRKILYKMELTKGWNSLDTVIAAEQLALTLQSLGILSEAHELLERCLDSRKALLPEDHIQNAGNMLHIARVKMLTSNQLRDTNNSQAMSELNMAKDLLGNSIRIAQKVTVQTIKQKGRPQSKEARRKAGTEIAALVILLQSLNALGMLETTKLKLQGSQGDNLPFVDAENAFRLCVSAFKEFGTEKPLSDSPEVKAEYLSCLKHLLNLLRDHTSMSTQQPTKAALEELADEIKRTELELCANKGQRGQVDR